MAYGSIAREIAGITLTLPVRGSAITVDIYASVEESDEQYV